MRFDVVFETTEDVSATYGLVFIPSPVWVQGRRQLINLNPESPAYQSGGVRRLLAKEDITSRACTLVIHPEGNGTVDDLLVLLSELRHEGMIIQLCGPLAGKAACPRHPE
jgi:hypothetical protein